MRFNTILKFVRQPQEKNQSAQNHTPGIPVSSTVASVTARFVRIKPYFNTFITKVLTNNNINFKHWLKYKKPMSQFISSFQKDF